MKVQLLVNVQDVGKDGDVVDVKVADAKQLIFHGYAREVADDAPKASAPAKKAAAKATAPKASSVASKTTAPNAGASQ